jgi:hypothetical protein
MSDYADVRQRIISTVFSRRNASGGLDETYVAHVKIWEDTGPGPQDRKPRYILLSGRQIRLDHVLESRIRQPL